MKMALAALLALALAVPARADVAEAERLAKAALANPDAAAAETQARRALASTGTFSPTAFVTAGRKGEVVEDAFVAARASYRRHRALVYEALGDALLRQAKPRPAARHLRRAVLLERTPARVARLVDALLAAGEGAEALALLRAHGSVGMPPALFERAADLLGLASAQAELDRARASAAKPPLAVVEVPLTLPAATRLSTGGPFAWTAEPTIVYLAEASCRTCSRDLEALKAAVPAGARVAVVGEDPDHDEALRQVLEIYRYKWPVILGRGVGAALRVKPGRVVVVGRNGWGALAVDPPFVGLAGAADIVRRTDIAERRPRERWMQKPVEIAAPAPLPLTDEGLAPGEDAPAPEAWAKAVAAYRERRYDAALQLFGALEKDGWLLPPEARYDRALALGGLGRAAEARTLLLGIGDSRFQDEVDRALETVGTRRR